MDVIIGALNIFLLLTIFEISGTLLWIYQGKPKSIFAFSFRNYNSRTAADSLSIVAICIVSLHIFIGGINI